jgi:hypothetical protein
VYHKRKRKKKKKKKNKQLKEHITRNVMRGGGGAPWQNSYTLVNVCRVRGI